MNTIGGVACLLCPVRIKDGDDGRPADVLVGDKWLAGFVHLGCYETALAKTPERVGVW